MATTERPPAGAAGPTAPVPPHNLDAEESILGACMLSAAQVERVQETGLQASDFYRESHGRIWLAILQLRAAGDAIDAITVAAKLSEQGQLEDVGGAGRVTELAALVPAAGNAAHYARLVVDEARRRALIRAGQDVARLVWDGGGTTDELEQRARELLDAIGQRGHAAGAIQLNTHQEILETEIAAEQYLIDDLIPVGAVGTIAAVPEAHKSWLAQAIAIRVAQGRGWVLGKEITHQTPTGYLWQDDSNLAAATRVKLFEQRHPTPPDLPILWGINLGVELPRDLIRLRTTVQQNHLGLLVLDSFYNFVTADLKDEIPEQIVAQLKREICDQTGCTILIVDHMPWATDTNRQRLRAYGGVFKNAATRFGIYIDAAGDKLHIEARGNNIPGIPKTLAYWDPDALELKLVPKDDEIDSDDLLRSRMDTVLNWLAANPGRHTTKAVVQGCGEGAREALTRSALETLLYEQKVIDQGHNGQAWAGKRGSARYWLHANDPLAATSAQEQLLAGPNRAELPGNTADTAEATTAHEWAEAGPRFQDTSSSLPTVNLGPNPRAELGRGSSDHPAGSQADLGPAETPPPFRGEVERAEVQAPDDPTSAQTSARADREAWVTDQGWLLDDDTITTTILEHWPTTSAAELTNLLALRDRREAEELGTVEESDGHEKKGDASP